MRSTVLVAGRSGKVADALARLRAPDLRFACFGRSDLDLMRTGEIDAGLDALIRRMRPVAMVNAAAYTAVDAAEAEPEVAMVLNRDSAGALARAAARHGLPFVHLSTDYVFSGAKGEAYVENDQAGPLSAYGRSKLAGEIAVAEAGGRQAILRTAWLFGPTGTNFLTTMLRLAAQGGRVTIVADQWGTPTYAPDVAGAILVLLRALLERRDAGGLFHVVSRGETSWAGFAEEIFRRSARLGGPGASVERIASADYERAAPRPERSSLSGALFEARFRHAMPSWQDGVARGLQALLRR